MLGFTLNEEQDAFRSAVRGFAERSLAPRVEELERTETFPLDLFRELGRLGYLGVGYPEEYGGSGGDMVMRCLLIEEIARVNCGFAAALLAHVGLGCIPLLRFGTEEQKHEFLEPALRGEKLGCWGLSEPNSGSDAASSRTTAERHGDQYVINGSKMFITNGNIADYCLIAAYTDRTKRGTGISTFVGAMVPVIPFFFVRGTTGVVVAFVVSLVAHFLVGAAKSLFTLRTWWSAGLELTLAGVIVGGITYALGLLIKFGS